MHKLLDFLAKTPVILFLLITQILLGASFLFVEPTIGGPLLDLQMNGADAANRLAQMTAEQKHIHTVVTMTLDLFYPLVYGGFFIAIVARFAKRFRLTLAVPACIAIVADFAENAVQVLALGGNESFLAAKDFLTPLKYYAFGIASIIGITLLLIALVKWTRRKRKLA